MCKIPDNVLETLSGFPQITLATINCNSLNVSSLTSNHQKLKIYSIAKLNKDIIFLSDLRLKQSDPHAKEIEKQFLTNPYSAYNFLWHCSESKRGVGILYKTNLDLSVQIVGTDASSNWLAVRACVNGKNILLIPVYGPNEYDYKFFSSLRSVVKEYSYLPIIMAGDWNTTYSTARLGENPDVLNMKSLPNPKNSKLLADLCTEFKLVDPFRIFFPNK